MPFSLPLHLQHKAPDGEVFLTLAIVPTVRLKEAREVRHRERKS